MKIGGEKLVKKTRCIVSFKRMQGDEEQVYNLSVSPLPMGWYQRMQHVGMMEYPQTPVSPLKDRDGKLVVNPESRKIELVDNDNDPNYIRKLTNVNRRLTAIKVYYHIKDDPAIEFESVEPSYSENGKVEKAKDRWEDFANKLLAEFEEAGFTEQELGYITQVGEKIARMSDVEEGMKDFLSIQED